MTWLSDIRPSYSRLEGQRLSSRLAFAAWTLLMLTVFFLSLDRHLAPPEKNEQPGQKVASADRKKVFLLIIDALTPTVVDSGKLSFLEPLLQEGFRAEVEPCVDRLTIPCLRDAFTGQSSFGLFGAFDNLVAAEGLGAGHLFSDLRHHGMTSGGVAPGELDQFAHWLDRYDSDKDSEIEDVVQQLEDGLDLVVYHYVWLDIVTHRAHVSSPPYQHALSILDRQVNEILASLPPGYEFVVAGDHGHDEVGRHIQGLDVPTVFLASGSLWGQRTLPDRLPITSYRYLLGAKLGILPPPSYEGTDLHALLPPGSAIEQAASALRFKTEASHGTSLPWLPALASLGLWLILALAAPKSWTGQPLPRLLLLLVPFAALGAGALYPYVVAKLHFNLALPNYTAWIVWLLLVLALLSTVLGRARRILKGTALAVLALFWICYPQTLYPYGFYARVIPLAVAVTITFLVLRSFDSRVRTPVASESQITGAESEASRRTSLLARIGVPALGIAMCLGVAKVLAPVYVLNFAIKYFTGLLQVPGAFYWGFPLTWALLAAWQSKAVEVDGGNLQQAKPLTRNRAALGWGLFAFVAACVSVFVPYPAALTAVLVALAAVAYLHRNSVWLFLLGAGLLPQLVGLVPAYGVGLTVGFAWLVLFTSQLESALPGQTLALGSRRRIAYNSSNRWVEAGLLAALAYHATAYVSGLRPNGLDYQFTLAWLPGRLAEDLWFVVGAGLLVKVLFPAALVFSLLPRFGRGDLRAPIQLLIAARIGASALFSIGFLSSVEQLPRFRLLEICEDMIAWWFLLVVVSVIPRLPIPTGTPAATPRSTSAEALGVSSR